MSRSPSIAACAWTSSVRSSATCAARSCANRYSVSTSKIVRSREVALRLVGCPLKLDRTRWNFRLSSKEQSRFEHRAPNQIESVPSRYSRSITQPQGFAPFSQTYHESVMGFFRRWSRCLPRSQQKVPGSDRSRWARQRHLENRAILGSRDIGTCRTLPWHRTEGLQLDFF